MKSFTCCYCNFSPKKYFLGLSNSFADLFCFNLVHLHEIWQSLQKLITFLISEFGLLYNIFKKMCFNPISKEGGIKWGINPILGLLF